MSNLTGPTLTALQYALGPGGIAAAAEIDTAIGGSDLLLPDGQILVGNSGGLAKPVAMSGDVAIADTGATTVQATKLVNATLAAIKTDSGTKTLLAATAADRQVIIAVTVTTSFADGNGTQPTVSIGQTSSVSKFAATTDFTARAASNLAVVFAGTLTGGTALLATQVAGTGTTETGAYSITVHAIG